MTTGPQKDALDRYRDAFNTSNTLQHFGLRLDFPDGERVVVHLDPIRPEQRGGLGTNAVNGAVLAAMFDLVIGCTGALVDPTRRVATIQLSMQFERPATGDRLRAESRIERIAQNVLFASAQMFDGTDMVCARAQGIVARSDKPWLKGDGPALV